MKTRNFILITIVTLLLTSYAYPWFVFNEDDTAFCEECNPDGSQARSALPMRQLIIYGADSFLESYSNTLALLRQVETSNLADLDQDQFLQTLDISIENMENSISFYNELKRIAAVTPYRNYVIKRLKRFDYKSFEKKTGLNPLIFKRVKTYLGAGNVRGSITAMYEDLNNILDKLNGLREKIDPNTLVPQLWSINQMYVNTALFGQYNSQVMIEIQ